MSGQERHEEESRTISRREFMKLAGIAGAGIGLAGGLGGFLAACGSESTTTTTAASTETTAAATATTAATTVTAGGGGMPATAAGVSIPEANPTDTARIDAYVQAVSKPGDPWSRVMAGDTSDVGGLVTELMAPNTWNGPTSSPPLVEGKNIVIVPCMMAAEGCSRPSLAFQEAAEAVGWTTTLIDPAGDPAKVQAAYKQAITMKADGIWGATVMLEQISTLLADLKAAGIVLGTCGGQDLPSADGWDLNVYERDVDMGSALAAYLGLNYPDAKLLVLNDSEYSSVRDANIALYRGLATYAPNCTVVDYLDFSIVDMATTLPQRVKASLLAHPEIDWVYSVYDACAAQVVSAILQSEGLKDKVKVFSWNGDPRNMDFIAKGEVQTFTTARCLEWVGYAGVDQFNRVFNGQPVFDPCHEYVGTRLFDKSNVPADTSVPWSGDFDFKAEYKKIWTAGEG